MISNTSIPVMFRDIKALSNVKKKICCKQLKN